MKTSKRLIADIVSYRKFIIYNAKVGLEAEVTNAYLDWLWWILEPVCSMLVYYLIFGIVFKVSEPYYLVFIYSALTMWGFFNRSVNLSVKLIKSSKSIITKVYIPKPVILISKMMIYAFKMLISSIIVVVLMIPYRVPVDWHLIGIVPVLIVFFVFCYGCSCYLMHVGVFIEDMSYVINIVLNILFYFTGIFYSISKRFPQPYGNFFEDANPLAFFIAQMRCALIYETNVFYKGLAVWFIVSIIIAITGTKLVYKNENSYVKVI
ncbi:teichoic acid transport system permease protein [Pseudobutyrivibrio ruminis]|uniref:Transport permease protein n=1 Tax=Pseudobutyrivibrio ruminis TaxID=46206 RepID=A0A1H7F6V1_9FIRM|nr:ABC transporter permease [Pseudobutyrivibrio ruminis]SEK21786.1 teichoic acid transport system permease protein [Pseudobutyrivibrio ruminis]